MIETRTDVPAVEGLETANTYPCFELLMVTTLLSPEAT